MRLKRLELYGFKSFPHRVEVAFPSGICAIVGPNGSGKSNIVDAVRWVLGEQSPRRLRARAMEDVIFSGSNGRGPNFAEVRLVLENNGQAPGELADLPEIVITRRLYRSGESEYLLNGRPCRLKDIHYLFMDTGAGHRAYAIIDQGEVGSFVELRPEERRLLIEEVAGVS
ncbi:MAG TPA: chromosome segregation protein SMC, partial [Thermodesulfatator sp.]|nr:chromosome segregation protein SMC [Thermodesulfatator sp.]